MPMADVMHLSWRHGEMGLHAKFGHGDLIIIL